MSKYQYFRYRYSRKILFLFHSISYVKRARLLIGTFWSTKEHSVNMALSLGVEVYESYKVLNFEILSISQLSLGLGRMSPVGIDTLNSPVRVHNTIKFCRDFFL